MSGRSKGKKTNKSPRPSPINRRTLTRRKGNEVSDIAASVLGLDKRDYRIDGTGQINIRGEPARDKARKTIEGLQKEQRDERLRLEEQERISDYPCDDQRCNEKNNQCPWDQEVVNKLITLFLNPDAKETTTLRTKGTKRGRGREGGKRKKTVKRYSKNTKKK